MRHYDLHSVRLVRVHHERVMNDAELLATLEEHRRALLAVEREKMHAIFILDLDDAYSMTARQRRIQSDWNRETAELMRRTMLGLCFVTRSAVLRGLVTAVSWVSPPVVPYEVCSSMQKAMAWSFRVCENAGVRAPEVCRREAAAALMGEQVKSA